MDNEGSDLFLNSTQIMARYGGASHMWIIRRIEDADFPKPTYLGRLRFWKLSELVAWERDQATKSPKRNAKASPKPIKKRRAA